MVVCFWFWCCDHYGVFGVCDLGECDRLVMVVYVFYCVDGVSVWCGIGFVGLFGDVC